MKTYKKIYNYLNSRIYFSLFMFILLMWMASISNAISCDSCGRECTRACGTKHFRTCCFNYLRKRSDPSLLKLQSAKSTLPSSSGSSSVFSTTSDLETPTAFLINSISDEQIYDPNINYRVLEQIIDDIQHDSKSLEIEVRKALNTRKAEYAEKKHQLQEIQQQQLPPQPNNIQQKELDY
ncbi:uncharacterized protein LOC129616218 [Condylostylus longicornis]|uniref:uncharacterized protein LOC129616218 n=1 Tax=Condylostylus longicornis TaxID=2530218 RepID=UPI00244E25EF|nr:uncharacterized protein LOC129616218 [Condylostylus longicornis]